LKETDPWDDTDGSARYLKACKRKERACKKLKGKDCGKREKVGDFSSLMK
jgi:hypothetical protein